MGSSSNCTSGSLAPHPNDCGSFLICNHRKYVTLKCAAGQHFDSKIKACTFPHRANCHASNSNQPPWNSQPQVNQSPGTTQTPLNQAPWEIQPSDNQAP